ncbi:DUF4129 domain-containing transglutaminase family protein [Paenisporosarcina cavernae]|uniref:Transglutaminase n=1 Tax=Paenisporosarcina cavernae TaxID=2320858 RepID=A0A385YVL3_9BACL|nr:transglutaminase domain-containing protein [Paenisporosarcina cavernae]AYC30320.1 transglutaminase [Paenisporosarcina cavernae]
MTNTSRPHTGIVQLILYVLVFLLLREWLIPVMQLTSTGYLTLFLLFVIVCLIVDYLEMKKVYAFLIKMVFVGWALVFIYQGKLFSPIEGTKFLLEQVVENGIAIFSMNWGLITDPIRTFLFFALLWMITYLIHHWLRVKMSILLFFILTVVFIASLDTFSPYDGDHAIIRIMLLGLVLSGLLKIARLYDENRVSFSPSKFSRLSIPLVVIVLITVGFGYLLPKAGPIWQDPVPFLQSFAEDTASNGTLRPAVSKIGYDEDDSQLGGSFIGDDTVVFEAIIEDGTYWKIENKDVYTGKGWEVSTPETEKRYVNYGNNQPIETDFPVGPAEDADTAEITMREDFEFLVYPYGMDSVNSQEDISYALSLDEQKVETYVQARPVNVTQYTINYSETTYSLKALRETKPEMARDLPIEFDRYLQLPETLPQRVRDLAETITASQSSLYDKAVAIERYFSGNNFVYDQTSIPVPDDKQDYVDQFLFESKRGYCDNFSTSMVVMLRSIGIPARWTKGFAEGEEVEDRGPNSFYEVTNNSAHSWVEAYMPNVGWVAFEPTIGFSGATNVEYDVEANTVEPPPTPEETDTAKPQKVDKEATFSFVKWADAAWDSFRDWLDRSKGTLLKWGIITAIVVFILFKIRRYWLPRILVPYYRLQKNDWHTFEKRYYRLLKQLELYGITKQEGYTLQQYATYVDQFFETKDMRRLTAAFERGFYGNKNTGDDYAKLRESWENLINRTTS